MVVLTGFDFKKSKKPKTIASFLKKFARYFFADRAAWAVIRSARTFLPRSVKLTIISDLSGFAADVNP